MSINYFNQGPSTFEVTVPVTWENERPAPLLLSSVKDYQEFLPTLDKNLLKFETFTFIMWNFGMENWIRENSISVNPVDGVRYLDIAKFRENKIRYLLTKWTLLNDNELVEPLEHTVIDGRQTLSDRSIKKVLGLDSTLVFSILIVADRVLDGTIPIKSLYTRDDYDQLQKGQFPERLKSTQSQLEGTKGEISPKA